MWTTVDLDDDVVAVERMRQERGLGISAAVNELARRGSAHATFLEPRFVQQSSAGNARLDLTGIADVLESLDGPGSR